MIKLISSKKGLSTEFIKILFIIITLVIIISLVVIFASKGYEAGGGYHTFIQAFIRGIGGR